VRDSERPAGPAGRLAAGRHRDGGRDGRAARRHRTGRRGWLAITAIAVAGGMLIAACGSSTTGSAGTPHVKASSATPASQLSITPADGSKDVNPGGGVTVTAKTGTIKNVVVTSGSAPVAGTLNAAGTEWHSTWALSPSASYTVTATGKDAAGATATTTSSFRTLAPAQTQQTMIFEGENQTYGVGMPIILKFSTPVTNKSAVESALQVTTSKPVVGAWYWDGDQTLYFRPQTYWPAGTQVSFVGHLDGVESAPGVYSMANLTQTFDIGPSLIVIASTKTHYMQVYYEGKLFGNWPISSGRPGLDSVNGTYLTIEKGNPVRMVGNGYNELVNYAVRYTYSGDYIHDAPWSVSEQGFTNVSHGCLNTSPAHSQLYYSMAVPGDPVTVTGSPAAGKWDDGWTVWFLTWEQLLQGSALHEAVQAGPSGSTFVNPSTLPAAAAASALQSSQPDNAVAQ
jgi:lipoprotein-anchoring transpeptidase ErfK/SrfK